MLSICGKQVKNVLVVYEVQRKTKFRSGGRACKPDSIMREFAKSLRVLKLGVTLCHCLVYGTSVKSA
jgi:hypothetical protein